MSTIRTFITGSMAVLALGLAGGLAAPAAVADQAVSVASVDRCAKFLQEAKNHEKNAATHLAAAKKAAQAGDKERAKYHQRQAAMAQDAANAARAKYNQCRS